MTEQPKTPPLDLSHLHPAVRHAALLPAVIRADRWIGYPRASQALTRLQALLAGPIRQRMPNMLLIGPTNNGKSMIIEKFRRAHPPGHEPDREHIPVLCLQMPPNPSPPRFYSAILASLGAPTYTRDRTQTDQREQIALDLLKRVGVRALVIDELHNPLAGRSDTRREFLNVLRYLGNQLRIPLVGVGTQEAYLAIRSDEQLENRFEPFTLLPRVNTASIRPSSLSASANTRCTRCGARASPANVTPTSRPCAPPRHRELLDSRPVGTSPRFGDSYRP